MISPKLATLAAAAIVSAAVLAIGSRERAQIAKDERLHVAEQLSAARARLEAAIHIPISSTRAIAMVYATHYDLPEDEFSGMAAQAKNPARALLILRCFAARSSPMSIRSRETKSSSGWTFATCPCSGRLTRE